eukprot:scaffold1355_cov268-Pinguiococcus_pyrenoidosus.AAC.72
MHGLSVLDEHDGRHHEDVQPLTEEGALLCVNLAEASLQVLRGQVAHPPVDDVAEPSSSAVEVHKHPVRLLGGIEELLLIRQLLVRAVALKSIQDQYFTEVSREGQHKAHAERTSARFRRRSSSFFFSSATRRRRMAARPSSVPISSSAASRAFSYNDCVAVTERKSQFRGELRKKSRCGSP